MTEPIKSPVPRDAPQDPSPQRPRPTALDRPPATWDEAAELADWAEREGPPPPAEDDMTTLTDLDYDWIFPAPLNERRELLAGWWIVPAAALGALFWWNLLGWIFG